MSEQEIPKGGDDAIRAGYEIREATPNEEAELVQSAEEAAALDMATILEPVVKLEKGYAGSDLHAALRTISIASARLEDLDRVMVLSELTRELKRIKAPAPADLAKSTIKTGQTEEDVDGLDLAPTVPWGSPVDGRDIADRVEGVFLKYMVLPEGASVAATLWVFTTYLTAWLYICARLAVTSPTKRCGKTTFVEIIAALSEKAISSSNMTTATIFRLVDAYSPTLLIDEADTWLPQNEEVRGIINAGFMKGRSSKVYRCTGDDHTVKAYETFAPVAIAGIGSRSVPDTIRDRSVLVELRRKTGTERVSRMRLDRLADETAPLRRMLARWAEDNGPALFDEDPEVPPTLGDREADCWRPLLAIANALGGDWPERAYAAAITLASTGEESAEDDIGITLLRDIHQIFTERQHERIRTETLLDDLHARDDRPWREWSKGKPLSPNKLAKLLEDFKIRPKLIRFAGGPARGFERNAFEDAFSRYISPPGGSQSVTPLHASNGAGSSVIPNCYTSEDVTASDSDETASLLGCNTVTLLNGQNGSPEKKKPLQPDTDAPRKKRVTL